VLYGRFSCKNGRIFAFIKEITAVRTVFSKNEIKFSNKENFYTIFENLSGFLKTVVRTGNLRRRRGLPQRYFL